MDFKILVSDMDYGPDEEQAALQVVADRWLTMGPRTADFEQSFSRTLDGCPCALVSSGTTALHLALHALGVGPGDEVIVPSLTFVATANVVIQVGARCVFADIVSLEEPLMDPRAVQAALTPRTRAVMPVHYAGFRADMSALEAIVKKERARRKKAGETRPLDLVEDAAHAAGARDEKGRPLGAIGAAGCFSFFSNKNIASGEGGLVAASDPALMKRLRLLRSHGVTRQTWERHKGAAVNKADLYDVIEPGFNYRPTEITAALAAAQLRKIRSILRTRKQLFNRAHKKLGRHPDIILPFLSPERWGAPAFHILPILVPDEPARIRIAAALAAKGIQNSHHYRPVHTMTWYKKRYPNAAKTLPVTSEYAGREITLPLHTRLTLADMDRICETLLKEIE